MFDIRYNQADALRVAEIKFACSFFEHAAAPFVIADAARMKILRMIAIGIASLVDPTEESVRQAIVEVMGRKSMWSKQIAKRYCKHYRSRIIKKRSGNYRLIEAPRSRLKFVQRIILHEILDLIPVSEACFGFVKDRNVRQFGAVHCCQGVVIRMDLEDFFPSIATGRVHALWRFLGYEDQVATYLTWLCTIPAHPLPMEQMDSLSRDARHYLEEQSCRDRLPQGAPTSGALANLIAYRMDQRFTGFVEKSGGRPQTPKNLRQDSLVKLASIVIAPQPQVQL